LIHGGYSPAPLYRFGAFELDLKTGELKKHGIRVRLQEQPRRVLQLLLQNPGEVVTREEFHRHLWSTGIFVDFDRSLNRAIVRLRQSLGDKSEAPRYIETLPRRGYRFLAPVETVTHINDQTKRTAGSLPTGLADPLPPPSVTSRRARFVIQIVVIVAATLAAAASLLPGPIASLLSWRQNPRIRSVAVLPLKNLSGDSAQDYFADGITDEITTDLARITALRVVSATTSRKYRETGESLQQIARELNVDAVVEGSIARSSSRIRVNAQLIDAHNDVHVWAQIYERDAGEILEIQDSIALEVANQVHANLSHGERESFDLRKTIQPEAYDTYLRGRNELGKQRQEALRKGLEYFKQSVALDRLYAPAYSGMADAYSLLANYGGMPPKEAFPRAKSAALKALDLDHTLADGHTSLAYVRHHFDWDWAGAEEEYKQSIQLDPSNAITRLRYAEFLSNEDRHQEAIREVRVAHELAPRSLVIKSNIGRLLYYARRYDEAITELKTILAYDSDRVYARIYLALCYEQKQMYPEALAEFQRVTAAFNGQEGIGIAHLYASMGKAEDARRIVSVQEQPAPDGVLDWFYIAGVYAQLGDKDNAFLWLERAFENRDFFLTFVKVDPQMEPLRSDPRFKDLLTRIGFPQ
jgi:TolB-like protein/DNA-binding winged helix-turn-helix (wHTH) protein